MTLAEMKRLYVDQHLSTVEIGQRCSPPVAPRTVNRRLRAAGVEIRHFTAAAKARWGTAEDRRDQLLDLRHELGSSAAVADALGLHQSTVQELVRRDGPPIPRSTVRARIPEPPDGMLTLTAAAAVRTDGMTADRLGRLAAAGRIPTATREIRWPHRWLVPKAGADRLTPTPPETAHAR